MILWTWVRYARNRVEGFVERSSNLRQDLGLAYRIAVKSDGASVKVDEVRV